MSLFVPEKSSLLSCWHDTVSKQNERLSFLAGSWAIEIDSCLTLLTTRNPLPLSTVFLSTCPICHLAAFTLPCLNSQFHESVCRRRLLFAGPLYRSYACYDYPARWILQWVSWQVKDGEATQTELECGVDWGKGKEEVTERQKQTDRQTVSCLLREEAKEESGSRWNLSPKEQDTVSHVQTGGWRTVPGSQRVPGC